MEHCLNPSRLKNTGHHMYMKYAVAVAVFELYTICIISVTELLVYGCGGETVYGPVFKESHEIFTVCVQIFEVHKFRGCHKSSIFVILFSRTTKYPAL